MNTSKVPVQIQRSSKQRDDIPLKILIVNYHLVVDKKPLLENMMESTKADIVLSTESWLKSDHISTAIFPKGYKVYCKDRPNKKGGGVFILVTRAQYRWWMRIGMDTSSLSTLLVLLVGRNLILLCMRNVSLTLVILL